MQVAFLRGSNQYLQLILLLCALFQPLVYADIEQLANMSFAELSSISVTASTLTDESIKSVPSSVSVYTAAQIKQLGARTLEDLFHYIPGYQAYRNDTGNYSYSSRSRSLTSNTREVLQLIDGQRINEDLLGSDLVAHIAMENVARVEFIRGPGSAIYGANAFLGVINIVTKKEQNTLKVKAGTHEQQAFLGVSRNLQGDALISLAAKYQQAPNERQLLFDPVSGQFVKSRQRETNGSIYLQTQWKQWSLKARHAEYDSERGYAVGTVENEFNHNKLKSTFISINNDLSWQEKWRWSNKLFHSSYMLKPNFRSVLTPTIISEFDQRGSRNGFDSLLSWSNDKRRALVGINYTQNKIHKSDFNVWLPPLDPSPTVKSLGENNRSFVGIFAQIQGSLYSFGHRNLAYTLGLRHDSYSDVKGYTSPRLGLIWDVGSANTLKLLYGEAFRAPTRGEVSIRNNTFQLGNPNLKPEIAKTLEIIWVQAANNHTFAASLYKTNISDSIELTNRAPPNTYINADAHGMSGAELEWHWAMTQWLQLRGVVSNQFQSALRYNNDAKETASLKIIYGRQRLSFSFAARYRGPIKDANTTSQGYTLHSSYALYDAHLNIAFDNTLSVSLGIRNITDKAYRQPAQQNPNNYFGVPGFGRELELGLTWNY